MRYATILVALVVAGCDSGGSPFSGPVQMAIDPATNNQTALAAASDSLDRSVDAVLWRGRGANAGLRFVTPAYAQTAVDGAPVVGGLVNSVGIGEIELEAWNPSALTDEDGKARFWYEQGTRAGEACAEIRYADGDTRMVTDTACASVAPGPPVGGYMMIPCGGIASQTDTLNLATATQGLPAVVDQYENPIPWKVRAFPNSALYAVGADSQVIVAAADTTLSGIDSVQVVAADSAVRLSHVYVRHPEVNARVLLYNWNRTDGTYDCGEVSLPKP